MLGSKTNFSKTPCSTSTVKPSSVTSPSETALTNFLNCINDCPSKPALLSLVPAHSDSYIPKSVNPELPVVLSSLFDNSIADADYPTLLKKSEKTCELLQVTKKQQEVVEEKTCEQAMVLYEDRADHCFKIQECLSHQSRMSITFIDYEYLLP